MKNKNYVLKVAAITFGDQSTTVSLVQNTRECIKIEFQVKCVGISYRIAGTIGMVAKKKVQLSINISSIY